MIPSKEYLHLIGECYYATENPQVTYVLEGVEIAAECFKVRVYRSGIPQFRLYTVQSVLQVIENEIWTELDDPL